MAIMDNASEIKLSQTISYLRHKSNNKLWARLYQKIIFLMELEFYKRHQQLSIGVNFQSYKYGPFSVEIAQMLDNPNIIEAPQNVKQEINEILRKYELTKFDKKSLEKSYNKMIHYIHSLKIYNMTPFGANFNFNSYSFEDIFKTIDSKLDGTKLEQEKYKNMQIEKEAKKYEALFE
ncbi:type II toxin-antitoxin system antitoxin SocA domain-containing protein [Helicobacter turcicus]|uniref:SocA family protein n=1 Tax=Helicobacter turcicus TaxID=2867412 RepID=A0ABS7JPG8_9HELI|nr:type II toxin-antitoxin system antitoxin SocA domain-containing protein [Helicobacter turcicus]MBX7491265.1 SocA family protein [Helicobacter turcicus]MBX7546096.1 SocA family protein [Helicobacter turcicus]